MRNSLKALRIQRGWSQAVVAQRLGVSRQTVNGLEIGRSDPSLRNALRLAKLFRTNVESIFLEQRHVSLVSCESGDRSEELASDSPRTRRLP